MDIQRIDKDLLNELLQKALKSERHRYAHDLRNSPEDTSQRILNLHVVFFEEREGTFKEISRVRLCPEEGFYGVQIPIGAWHTVQVHEVSVIFEAKDGAYGK